MSAKGEDVEEEFAHGVGGVVDGGAELELDVSFGEVVADLRSSLETTKVSPARAWSGFVSAGEAVVGVDSIGGDSELSEGLGLGGELLFVGGAPGVSYLHL